MMRRLLFWVLVIAFGWVIIGRFSEIEKLAQTLREGRWQWIVAAASLQFIYYALYTLVYEIAFRAVGVPSRLRDLLPLTFAAVFINSTAPSGGAAGLAVFVDDASRRGQSGARAAAGTLLVTVADFGAFLLILAAGLIILFVRHNLKSYEIITGLIMFLYVGGMAAVLGLGLWRPDWLRRTLRKLQNGINRAGGWFRHPTVLRQDWSEHNTQEFEESAQLMASRPRQLLQTVAIAFLAHAIDVASLWALFQAFHVSVTLGVVIAGYAMTILFWIVSPTPNGIGVVEGLMPVVYTSLGLPTAAAAIITLAFRGLSFWIPFLIGFALLRRLRMFSPPQRSLAHVGQVRLIAYLTALMGLLNVVSAATPSLANRAAVLEEFSPLAVTRGSNITAVLAGFALLLLAQGLARRHRSAWLLTLTLLIISIISHLLKGLDYEEAILAGLLAAYLIWQRAHFQARSDPPSTRRGLWLVTAAMGFTLAYGTTGFYLLDRHYSVNFSLGAALRQAIVMFTEFYNPGLEPLTGFGVYFADSIYIVGAVTFSYGLLMILRPVILRAPSTTLEREHAQKIVEEYGRSSLARFLLLPGKAYWFSPGGSLVGYAAKGKTAVALGDPIGPADDAAAAITGFRDHCHQQGWQAAFYQTLPDHVDLYKAAGFEAVRIGHEAIVDLRTFTLEGKAGKPFRTAINHMTRLGHRAEFISPPLGDDLLQQLREISDEWLTMMHGKEKQFSLGWFQDDYVCHSEVIVVYTELGQISAFANLVPEYSRNEASVDLMRRRKETESGTMDFLFARLLQHCQEQGYDTFNLGLSSLSGVGESSDDPAVEKALHYFYDHVNQFYSFQGLHAFKEKFHPTWEPRFVVFPGVTTLPAVWTTLAKAGTGDSLVWSYIRDLPPALKQMAQSVRERAVVHEHQ